MADGTLLGNINRKSISEFRKDLLEMLRIGKELDEQYGDLNQNIEAYIKKFDSLIKLFNKKYKNITLKLVKKTDKIELKIFLNEKTVKDAFANSASKVTGVQAIGASKFDTAGVADPEIFTNELEKAKDKLYISYYNPQTGTSKVYLQYDKKIKKIQLVYDIEDIENESSAEFQIAVYYACQEYNQKIKLHEEAATLGFSLIPDHLVKRKYLDKHDPHLSE